MAGAPCLARPAAPPGLTLLLLPALSPPACAAQALASRIQAKRISKGQVCAVGTMILVLGHECFHNWYALALVGQHCFALDGLS